MSSWTSRLYFSWYRISFPCFGRNSTDTRQTCIPGFIGRSQSSVNNSIEVVILFQLTSSFVSFIQDIYQPACNQARLESILNLYVTDDMEPIPRRKDATKNESAKRIQYLRDSDSPPNLITTISQYDKNHCKSKSFFLVKSLFCDVISSIN